MLKQPENLGLYFPAFFFIKIHTDESLIDLEKCTKHTQATFFHEYLHFLQDFYTLYGLRNISYNVNVVYSIYKESIKQKELHFPIKLPETDFQVRKDLFNYYYGTYILSYDPFELLSYTIMPNNSIAGYEYLEQVEIETLSFNVGKDSFSFGAYAILESLAYLVEKSIFGISSPFNFPYNIVDLIIDQFFTDLQMPTNIRIALCEEALNSAHPGRTFFTILEGLKIENQKRFNDPQQFHLFCQRHFFLQDESGFKFSMSFAIESETQKSQLNLKTYFQNDEIVKVNPWIDFVFELAKQMRKEDFHFYKLYENRDKFVEIINNLGTPLVSNNFDFFFKNPKIDQSDCHISIFLAIRELMLIALGEKSNCDLKSRCLSIDSELVNEYCDSAPHENRKNSKKCGLTALMLHWGLK